MKNKTLTIDKKIEKLVQNSKIGLTPVKVIQDIAQLAYNCLKKSIELRGWRYHEADWLIRSLDEYKNDPASWEVIQELTVEYIEMVKNNPPFTDIFELIGFPNNKLAKQLGQFLTPSKLATGASKFVEVAIQGDKNITICDIGGCGAGSMLLAPLRTLYEDTPNKLNQAHLLGVDIDPNMVLLTAVQIFVPCVIHDIPLGSLEVHCAHGIIDYEHYTSHSHKTLSFVFYSNLEGLKECLPVEEDEPELMEAL